MTGIHHQWGEDLQFDNRGGLKTTDTTKRNEQRLIRRFMTNPGDMQDSPIYGAGVRQFIGQNTDAAKIKATLLQQARLEQGVSQNPGPDVNVRVINSEVVVADVQYTDANTGSYPALQIKLTR
jgi:hypothetical protein